MIIALNPINSLVLAVCTAVIVQILTVFNFGKYSLQSINDDENDFIETLRLGQTVNVPLTYNSDEIVKMDESLKLLTEAIFVSHGQEIDAKRLEEESGETFFIETKSSIMEDVNKETTELKEVQIMETAERSILDINPESFNALLENNWLILTYVDWTDNMKRFKDHFVTQYAQSTSKLNFAILNAEKYPFLAAQLNVRQYPTLSFVTESGGLRPWPFPRVEYMNQDIQRFLTQSLWTHLPVYRQIHSEDSDISGLQIAIFNIIAKTLIQHLNPTLSKFIKKNPNYTIALISISLLSLMVTSKKFKWTNFIF